MSNHTYKAMIKRCIIPVSVSNRILGCCIFLRCLRVTLSCFRSGVTVRSTGYSYCQGKLMRFCSSSPVCLRMTFQQGFCARAARSACPYLPFYWESQEMYSRKRATLARKLLHKKINVFWYGPK